MEKLIDEYIEKFASIKKFMDEVENAKIKLNVSDNQEKSTPINMMVQGSLEKSPFYHPSIDDIFDEIMNYIKTEKDIPSKYFTPLFHHITPNDVYKIILAYFPNNPILMNYVSGVIKHGMRYHTCHWKNTVDKIMNYKGISDPTKVRLTEHVLESGEIKIDTDTVLKCYYGEYDAVLTLINEIKECKSTITDGRIY